MMPNVDTDVKDSVLFECECGGSHFLEVSLMECGDKTTLFISMIDRPRGLFEIIRHWLKNRQSYVSEIELRDGDVKVLRDKFNEYLGEKGE